MHDKYPVKYNRRELSQAVDEHSSILMNMRDQIRDLQNQINDLAAIQLGFKPKKKSVNELEKLVKEVTEQDKKTAPAKKATKKTTATKGRPGRPRKVNK